MLRCMNRNRRYRSVWFALYQESEELTEQKGEYILYTGDREGNYTEPVEIKASVEPKSYFYNGDATVTRIFGTDLEYDKVMVVDWANKAAIQIDEYSKLWVDVNPYDDNGRLQPHDYEVKRVQITHDGTAYMFAIGRVSRDDSRKNRP